MFQLEKTYQSWSWERVSRHVLYWLAWLLFYSIINSTYNDDSIFEWACLELLIMGIKLPFTYFVIYTLVPNYFLSRQYLIFFVSLLATAILGGIAIWALYYYIFNPFFFDYEPGAFWSSKIAYKVIDLIYVASIPTILKLYQRQIQQEKHALLLVEQKLGAELKLLKNQLHPHFLFNTLNNLYSMVLIQHPKAADVVVRLSDIMSYMLYECERLLIDLEKEIENLKNYIELEKIRYGKRLEISFETKGTIAGNTIAPLLLLPFLENAFKHGVEKNEQISKVYISLFVNQHQLRYRVENTLPDTKGDENIPSIQSGVGLANVRKRLELLYPDRHQLEIKNGTTFIATLTLNLNHEVSHR